MGGLVDVDYYDAIITICGGDGLSVAMIVMECELEEKEAGWRRWRLASNSNRITSSTPSVI